MVDDKRSRCLQAVKAFTWHWLGQWSNVKLIQHQSPPICHSIPCCLCLTSIFFTNSSIYLSLPLPHYPPVPYLSLASPSTFKSLCPSPYLSLYPLISQFPFPLWHSLTQSIPLSSKYLAPSPPILFLLPISFSFRMFFHLISHCFCPLYHKLSSLNLCILPDFKMDPLYLSSSPLPQSLSILQSSLSMSTLPLHLSHTFNGSQTVSSLPLC